MPVTDLATNDVADKDPLVEADLPGQVQRVLTEYLQTRRADTAELDPAAKDAISHRGQAVRGIMPLLVAELKKAEP